MCYSAQTNKPHASFDCGVIRLEIVFFGLKIQLYGSVQAGGKFANRFFHIRDGRINTLPGGIAHDDHIIEDLHLRPLGNVREKGQTDAGSARLIEFQSDGILAGGDALGHDPEACQRLSQKVGVAAVNHKPIGNNFEHFAADETAAIDAIRSDLLRVCGGAGGCGFFGVNSGTISRASVQNCQEE